MTELNTVKPDESGKLTLSKADRQKVWWRSTFLQGSWNYERMQNLGWAYSLIPAIKKLYTDRKITVIFQPHLYTRTRDFYKDFADALSHFDEVILTEIYPAREQPIEGVTSKLIYDNLRPNIAKQMIKKDDVLDFVKSRDFDVLVVLGAGNLDNYVPEITKIIKAKE